MSSRGSIRTAAIIAGRLALSTSASAGIAYNAVATEFTAERVMKDMKSDQRFHFVAGIVEGLAVARYFRDGKKPTGMNCIYGWFYDDNTQAMDTIEAAFGRYASYPPGSIIYNLAKSKCGE